MTFNLMSGSYKPYKKPKDTLSYINKNLNHPPQIIKKLPKTTNDRLCRNSSNAEIFHASKVKYETALRNSGYKKFDFKYNLAHKNNNKRSRQRNIILFNPLFTQAVSANIAKRFLDLLHKHLPQNNHLHKIFNISYSCTPNVGSIIKSHNKKLTMLKTSKRNIATAEKSKNVRCKVNVDLRISYTNVQLQQQLIHEKFAKVQQKVTLGNDITIRESHLEIESMQMRHRHQNTSGKGKVNTI